MAYKDRPKILVVDDNHATQILIRLLLGSAGYELFQASDADEAIQFVKAYSDISLVILDLRMPKSGGEAFLKARGHMSELKATPVMLLSGDQSLYDVAARFGIKHCLLKGGKPASLVEYVRQIVPSDSPSCGA